MKKIYTNWDETLFFQYIKKLKLPEGKPSKEYSNGMLMKLKLITCLSHHPKLLILDEPTSGLDPIVRSEILEIFQEFIEDEEHSILVSSHITSDLEHIADYIIFISNGSIILNKTKDELLEQYGIVKCNKEEFKAIKEEDYIKYIHHKYEYELLVENKKNFKKKYNIKVIDKPTIEDIMLLYIKGEKEK